MTVFVPLSHKLPTHKRKSLHLIVVQSTQTIRLLLDTRTHTHSYANTSTRNTHLTLSLKLKAASDMWPLFYG